MSLMKLEKLRFDWKILDRMLDCGAIKVARTGATSARSTRRAVPDLLACAASEQSGADRESLALGDQSSPDRRQLRPQRDGSAAPAHSYSRRVWKSAQARSRCHGARQKQPPFSLAPRGVDASARMRGAGARFNAFLLFMSLCSPACGADRAQPATQPNEIDLHEESLQRRQGGAAGPSTGGTRNSAVDRPTGPSTPGARGQDPARTGEVARADNPDEPSADVTPPDFVAVIVKFLDADAISVAASRWSEAPPRAAALLAEACTPKHVKRVNAAQKLLRRRKAWREAADVLVLYQAMTGVSQGAEIEKCLSAAEISEAKDAAKSAETAEDWTAARRMYTKLRELTGSRAYDSKIKRATANELEAQLAARYQRMAVQMRVGTSVVPGLRFSVTASAYRRCLGYECGRGSARFLLLHVEVANDLGRSIHVNPLHFTITSCREDSPTDAAMYSLDDSLPAVDLRSGSYARGWIAFFVTPECDHVLNYSPAYDASAVLKVAAPP
jgi:hypothetical protein